MTGPGTIPATSAVSDAVPSRSRRPGRWITIVFGAAAAVLAVWTVVLAAALDGSAQRTWVGYDVLLTAVLAGTAWSAHRRDRSLPLLLVATAAMVVADGWFDTMTAPSIERPCSVLAAAVIEIPFALVCVCLGVRVSRRTQDGSA